MVSIRSIRNHAGLVLIVMAALTLLACAGGGAPIAEQPRSVESNPESETVSMYGPSPAPAGEDVEASVLDDAVAPLAEAPATSDRAATQDAEPAATDARRTDGRPSWWIDAARRANGEVQVAAEALGPDIRAARRAAIDAGLARLERELGHLPGDWVVKATIIRPLRAVRGPENVNRFVGYVLIAAAD